MASEYDTEAFKVISDFRNQYYEVTQNAQTKWRFGFSEELKGYTLYADNEISGQVCVTSRTYSGKTLGVMDEYEYKSGKHQRSEVLFDAISGDVLAYRKVPQYSLI